MHVLRRWLVYCALVSERTMTPLFEHPCDPWLVWSTWAGAADLGSIVVTVVHVSVGSPSSICTPLIQLKNKPALWLDASPIRWSYLVEGDVASKIKWNSFVWESPLWTILFSWTLVMMVDLPYPTSFCSLVPHRNLLRILMPSPRRRLIQPGATSLQHFHDSLYRSNPSVKFFGLMALNNMGCCII